MNLQYANFVRCPICKGSVRPLDIVERYALPLLHTSATIEFGTCADCGFTTQMNPVSGDGLLAYYANSPRFRAEEDIRRSIEATGYRGRIAMWSAVDPLDDSSAA